MARFSNGGVSFSFRCCCVFLGGTEVHAHQLILVIIQATEHSSIVTALCWPNVATQYINITAPHKHCILESRHWAWRRKPPKNLVNSFFAGPNTTRFAFFLGVVHSLCIFAQGAQHFSVHRDYLVIINRLDQKARVGLWTWSTYTSNIGFRAWHGSCLFHGRQLVVT